MAQLHVVRYDQLRSDFDGAVDDVLGFVGLDRSGLAPTPRSNSNESMYSLPRLAAYRLRTAIRRDRDDEHGHTNPRQELSAPARWGSAALHVVDRRALMRFDRGVPPLAPDLRAELLQRYRDDTDALEAFLRTDLSHWKQ
jgi:hypothetical protein